MVIYTITNIKNNMKYVGQTSRPFETRIAEHCRGYSTTAAVDKIIKEEGIENFKFEIIEECQTREQMDEREIYYINKYNTIYPNGYNKTKGGNAAKRFKRRENNEKQKEIEQANTMCQANIITERLYKKIEEGDITLRELRQLGDILGLKIEIFIK